MNEGWIKIYYKMLDWEWMDDPYVVALWVRILLNANQRERKWHGLTVKRGQWITSVHHIAEQTGWSRNTVKRILRILEQSNQITVETSNNGVIITVTNYGKYQSKDGSNADPLNKPSGSNNDPQGDPLADPQGDPLTDPNLRKKEYKIVRKEEPPYGGYNAPAREVGLEPYGILHNVMLNAQQHRTLVEQYGEVTTATTIDELSCKLADGTFDSRNHYATLVYWLNYRRNTQPASQADPYAAERMVWASMSAQDQQEYLNNHGGKYPWQQ